ncbi:MULTISPECIES: sugar ABC transporter ATP-binding protein [unclassified Bacillus (in: firmicutes)]|uniref:sugar ABC transporter ATP-binding protein n=1 Tax=unclassified Bacillus (in: firmicutes) TaxID=185979 RepID=UPI0008DFCD9E|nr:MULTISPECIES: sugar ABC transporter ATP-binding protein [unclassified Bacillus (in: firmicutes)]SFA71273.1 monosaccharide ABC transporter ATP-binding protein, CUT2 family [Bacillus sp. UNCCL13]SFQ61444.1 monosaccharide ABC transporter ATP-binding protein, CUT2 family [Bacillus sp. cl95]
MAEAVLEMKDITIEFPGVKALNEVSFTARTGKVHALIGANGAGKSTLMKVLSGAHHDYSGEILLNGVYINIRTPRDAQTHGIQIVYQEVDTAIVPSLTVGENIMLNETVQGMEGRQWINWKQLYSKAATLLDNLNIRLSVKKLAKDLTLAEKQLVLIAKAISTNCKFLILDEPTAPLSNHETSELFRIISDLKKRDVGIIFISHRMPEIFEICDEITIMRNGEFILEEKIDRIYQAKVIEHMLGRPLKEQFPKHHAKIGETILEVKELNDREKVRNVTLHVKAGEIVGLAGLVGAGKTELCKTLFGDNRNTTGQITLHGRIVRLRSPHDAVKSGIALVPEERRKEGILVHESVVSNLTAANLKKFTGWLGFVNRKSEKATAKEYIKRLGIKTPTETAKVQNLSGGNQQKVAIGKWLVADADVYIFDEPTKGVDVGAKKDIFQLIAELANQGKAVLYATSELSEIMGISGRVYVLYDGTSVKELETSKTSEEEILFYSTGGK